MLHFLARRALQLVPTFLGITAITFAVSHLAEGDPLALDPDALARPGIARSATASSLFTQYLVWLWRVARLDFGRSMVDHREVAALLTEALPTTLTLGAISLLVSLCAAVPLGVSQARRPHSLATRLSSATLFTLASVPTFWVAVLLLWAFGRWLPFQGLVSEAARSESLPLRLFDAAKHLVLPVVCLSYPFIASLSLQVHKAMREALAQDYVLAARARGVPEQQVLYRHALPNALLPLITAVSFSLPALLGGSVVIERVFGLSGIGWLAFEAIERRDYPVVMAVATVAALITAASMLTADLASRWADPRLNHERL